MRGNILFNLPGNVSPLCSLNVLPSSALNDGKQASVSHIFLKFYHRTCLASIPLASLVSSYPWPASSGRGNSLSGRHHLPMLLRRPQRYRPSSSGRGNSLSGLHHLPMLLRRPQRYRPTSSGRRNLFPGLHHLPMLLRCPQRYRPAPSGRGNSLPGRRRKPGIPLL